MTTNSRSWVGKSVSASLLAMGGVISSGNCVLAQNITLDGSLGPAKTLLGQDYVIPQEGGFIF